MSEEDRFVRQYWSAHYSGIMPATQAQWAWAVERIDVNFGAFFAGLTPDSRILDVPCGVGYLEHYLLPHGFTEIRAVDASEEQIRAAEAKLRDQHIPFEGRVQFARADAFDYLRHDQGHSAIAAIDFLDHLSKEKILQFLDLCFAALVPRGLLMLRVTNAENPVWGQFFFRDFTHETPFTRSSLRQCLIVSGFGVVKLDFERVPPLRGEIGLVRRCKEIVRHFGLTILGRFLEVPSAAFTEDLVAVARKL